MLIRRKKTSLSDVSVPRQHFIVFFFCIVCVVFAARLYYLQFSGDENFAESFSANNFKNASISAQRGQIYDRFGNMLVSNVPSYNIEINRTTLASGASAEVLSQLIDILAEYGVELPDNCPLTLEYPYSLDSDYIFDDEKSRMFEKFLSITEEEKSALTGTDFYDFLTERYDIPDDIKNSYKGRKITAIRYDMEVNDFSSLYPYVLMSNVDEEIVTVISERKHMLHGIEISKSYTREYDMSTTLCHILGRVGPIFENEAQEYVVEKGYSYDAMIGKDGAEKVFEEYLHGSDGVALCEIDSDNNVVGYEITEEPKLGYSVRLSIDSGMQQVAEQALNEQIALAVEYSALEGGDHTGEDCRAGAAAVVDVNTGETLVLASVPGFDLNTFSEDYNDLLNNPDKPLINRATQGIYPPGSTFKMLTAAAALDTGTIDSNTYIYDKGEYDKYETYKPRCWVYLRHGQTHGYVNVSDAIRVSCNYFFYSIADQMGIDTIVEYAKDFGLGVKTGIEVPESEGILASPEYREANGYVWNPGDTLQMAIGQSDNAFTPLQLASYMSTIVNGGKRYKTTILKSIDEFYTGVPVYENQPEIIDQTHLSDQTVSIIKSAMRSVVDDEGGTAQGVFMGKPYAKDIGGKTGTAQVSNGSDTVLFVGFAPYDNPEIAVAVVVENGYSSSRAASVAASIFDYYYANYSGDTQQDGQ